MLLLKSFQFPPPPDIGLWHLEGIYSRETRVSAFELFTKLWVSHGLQLGHRLAAKKCGNRAKTGLFASDVARGQIAVNTRSGARCFAADVAPGTRPKRTSLEPREYASEFL